jgi:ubiquinone/menaquinone biosynthesis C-methylase UbiE
MTSYERFGEFYDAVMGDRRAATEQVMKLIQATKPDAKNVLELGCGTGSILNCLQDAYTVSGLIRRDFLCIRFD